MSINFQKVYNCVKVLDNELDIRKVNNRIIISHPVCITTVLLQEMRQFDMYLVHISYNQDTTRIEAEFMTKL